MDHYVVFGTKSGAEQDFQRGKKCPKGLKKKTYTPLKILKPLSKPPQTPPNPIIDPPYNQFDQSSYLITH